MLRVSQLVVLALASAGAAAAPCPDHDRWRLYRGFEREDSTVIGRHASRSD